MTGDDLAITAADLTEWSRSAYNGPPGSEANRRVLLLAAEVHALRVREAELQQRIDKVAELCDQALVVHTKAIRAALSDNIGR